MITRMKSEYECAIVYPRQIKDFLAHLLHRMWNEIKEKASLNLFNIYLYLAQDHIYIQKSYKSSKDRETDFYLNQPTPEIILNRWKCINDIYIENGFI